MGPEVNLLDELEAAVAPPPRICRIRVLFDQLSDAEAAAAEKLLHRSLVQLLRILRSHGHAVSDGALRAHRDGTCPCRTS